LLLIVALVYSPSLDAFWKRIVFIAGVLAVIWGITSLHNRYLPFAAIYMGTKPKSLIRRVGPSMLSWAISLVGTVLAAVIGAYLKGLLHIPATP